MTDIVQFPKQSRFKTTVAYLPNGAEVEFKYEIVVKGQYVNEAWYDERKVDESGCMKQSDDETLAGLIKTPFRDVISIKIPNLYREHQSDWWGFCYAAFKDAGCDVSPNQKISFSLDIFMDKDKSGDYSS